MIALLIALGAVATAAVPSALLALGAVASPSSLSLVLSGSVGTIGDMGENFDRLIEAVKAVYYERGVKAEFDRLHKEVYTNGRKDAAERAQEFLLRVQEKHPERLREAIKRLPEIVV